MKPSLNLGLTLLTVFVLVIACTPSTAQSPAPVDAAVPAAATPLPLYQQVTLVSSDNTESGQNPDYTITTRIPVLQGSDDARLAAFNAGAAGIVQRAVDEFKNNLVAMQPLPDLGTFSMFDVKYELLSPPGNLLSIKFIMEGYVEGAAHPYHVSVTFNYDLERGQELGLDALFLSGSDYLVVIANYCAAQLSTRGIGFDEMFSQGAAPAPENYQAWNVTPDGLLITFNEYQVAPYAAGPQLVTIPYAELSASIDPQGPLAGFAP